MAKVKTPIIPLKATAKILKQHQGATLVEIFTNRHGYIGYAGYNEKVSMKTYAKVFMKLFGDFFEKFPEGTNTLKMKNHSDYEKVKDIWQQFYTAEEIFEKYL